MSSRRKWHFRIEHILEAIGKVRLYTAGMTQAQLTANGLVADAAVRNFTIVGEAARLVLIDVQRRHPEIQWAQMQGLRNILVHEYDAVKIDVVWQTLQTDLPPLVEPLEALLREEPEGPGDDT